MPLDRSQLESAVNEVFYISQQLFAYFSWMTRVEPRLGDLPTPMHSTIVRNAVIEAQLLCYRKLNEFFRPVSARFPDDLKCELFGFTPTGGFMTAAEIEELHKRVAHPTTRQVTHGSLAYEIYDFSYAGLEQVLSFFTFLGTRFYATGSREANQLLSGARALRRLWDEWTDMVEAGKQKKLKA